MLNRMRTLMAWIARAQTKIATATSARKILPHVSPSTSIVTPARPSANGPSWAVDDEAISAKPNSRKPMMPAVASACRIARGARRFGSEVSSASDPAESNPYMT